MWLSAAVALTHVHVCTREKNEEPSGRIVVCKPVIAHSNFVHVAVHFPDRTYIIGCFCITSRGIKRILFAGKGRSVSMYMYFLLQVSFSRDFRTVRC